MEIPTTTTLSLPQITRTSSRLSSSKSLYFNNNASSAHLLKKMNTMTLSRSKSQTYGFNCRSMFGLGVPEIVVIAGVTTLLFGPKMVPQLGRSIGQTVKGFQEAAKEFQSELEKSQSGHEALEEVAMLSKEQQDAEVSATVDSS